VVAIPAAKTQMFP